MPRVVSDRDEQVTKTEQAYHLLRRDILATRLEPGASLPISSLRATYGLGWTPLREALSRLEAERLVTSESNRGFAVAPVSRHELEQLSKARSVVEVALLREALEAGGRAWEDRVVAAHYRLSRCASPVDGSDTAVLEEWVDLHQAFHEALLSAADSVWLQHFYRQIWGQLSRHHIYLTVTPALRASSGAERDQALAALRDAMALDEHTRLMELSLERDVEGAIALIEQHVRLTVNVYAITGQPAPEAKENA